MKSYQIELRDKISHNPVDGWYRFYGTLQQALGMYANVRYVRKSYPVWSCGEAVSQTSGTTIPGTVVQVGDILEEEVWVKG